jgi:hypothetical protein
MNTPTLLQPSSVSRRDFLTRSAHAAAAGLLGSAYAEKAPAASLPSETLVTQLYKTLDEKQKSILCLPWSDPRRQKVDNNWHIIKQPIRDVLNADQQAMVREIFDKLHSDEYKKEVWTQFDHDNKGDGGFPSASIALFGEPGTGQFEFVLTGRHCTRRCDGDSEKGAAFGGPIFYGHAAGSFNEKPDHPGNVYWYQAKRANEVFAALDGKQREAALLGKSRQERGNFTVELTGKKSGLEGIRMSDLSSDQKDLVRKVIGDLLKPFREHDAKEAASYIEAGGFDNLHMAFFKDQDVGKDGVWDVWQIEGPNAVFYFRGDPHVHAWAHVRQPA